MWMMNSGVTLPNLVLAGFPKCGTTSVAETLVRHPDVCGAFPHLRTRHFTPLLYNPAAELPSTDDYARHFRRWTGERIRLDDTPVWVYGGARIATAVRRVLGRPRLLIMLREPAARTASYLTWKKRHGELDQDLRLDDYVRECERLGPRAVDTAELNPYSGLYGSDYARYLPDWLDEFGSDLRIGFLDDLAADPLAFYRALASWLEIDPDAFTPETVQVANTAKAVRNPGAERVIRRIGRRVQPLARRTPAVYRLLRDGARKVNMRDVAPGPRADDTVQLRAFFAAGLPALAELVRGHELGEQPRWLRDAQSTG
jgi:hypothetical protein